MVPWIPLLVGLAGGGAAGALITAIINHRRNKRQPVGYTEEIIHIFRSNKDFAGLHARLIVREHPFTKGVENSVENLSLARYTLVNKGNQDITEYKFGITLDVRNRVIDFKTKEPDRHHVMKPLITDKEGTITDLDFSLSPFNRGDTYGVDVYFTYDTSPTEIKLSSPHSTVLTKITSSSILERERILRIYQIIAVFTTFGAALLGLSGALMEPIKRLLAQLFK